MSLQSSYARLAHGLVAAALLPASAAGQEVPISQSDDLAASSSKDTITASPDGESVSSSGFVSVYEQSTGELLTRFVGEGSGDKFGHAVHSKTDFDGDGSLAGIISIGDVVKARLGQLELENNQLHEYIQAR